jgi:phage-related minor tail protein
MMNFSLYGKKRVPTPSPAQLLLLKQREQYLQMQLLSKNNTHHSIKHESDNKPEVLEHEIKEEKDVIVYELGIETESL